MPGCFAFVKSDESRRWNRRNLLRIFYPLFGVVLVSLIVFLSSCRNNDNSGGAEAKTIDIVLQVEDAISKELLGGLEVTPRFYVEGLVDDLEVSLYDAGDSLVAGYANAESFKTGDVRVPGSGLLALKLVIDSETHALLNRLSVTDGAQAKLNLIISGDDHFSNVASFDIISDTDHLEQAIDLFPHNNNVDFPATSVEGTVTINGNVVNRAVSLSTPVESTDTTSGAILDGARMTIDISSGTELMDESGQPFVPVGDVALKMVLISGDPRGVTTTGNSPLFAFPGGLQISGINGNTPGDLTNASEFSFISAGFGAIKIEDDAGNKVSSFENGAVSLTFEVPKSTINPNTSLPIDFSDGSIPFWSYNDKTAQWSYEGEASIVAENLNTFTLTAQITHLSYFNLDWYESNRCQWDVNVVDASGQPNNQRLRLSFVRKSGGWAYSPHGWGGELDKLNIRRIPAFEGTFDILSNDGASLLDSITVDGVETSVPTGGAGVELSDFCFGLSTDSVKTLTAKLNVNNPPRIDLSLQMNLVCPTDSNSIVTTDSGSYYLYEQWSYVENGTVSNGQVDLRNLVEDSLYRFYYQNSTMWSRSEFSANESLTELNIETISVCPTISQSLKVRSVCLDDNQQVFKQKPAASTRYWIYNWNYYQYLSGTTNAQGSDTLTSTVAGIDYVVYMRVLNNGRYQWHGPVSFTAAADQETLIDIPLPGSDDFCTAELPVDFTQTTITSSASSAPADGATKIQITVQEKDEFGNNRNSNTGTLTLSATPSDNVVIDNIQSRNDGTYTADIYASSVADVIVTGAIDGNPLSDSVSLSFSSVAPSASQSIFAVSDTTATIDGDVTLSITLKSDDGGDYGQSGGTLSLSSTPSGATFSSVTDNGDGTYSANVSSASAASYTLSAIVGSVTLTTRPSVIFTDPPPSAAQSSFTLSNTAVVLGTNVTIDIVLKRSDGSNYGRSGGTLSLSSSPSGATFGSVTDNGDGTYSASVSSTSAASYTLSATIGSVTLTTRPSVTFNEPPPSAAQSTFILSSATAITGTEVTIDIVLKRSDGGDYGKSGGTLVLSSTPSGATFGSVTDNGDGSYSATVNSASPASYTLSATVGSVTLKTRPSISFTDPPPSTVQSTFILSSATAITGTEVTIDIVLKQSGGGDYGKSGGTLTLSSTPPGATFGSITDNGDGTYSATVSSVSATSYTLSATVGSVTLTTTPSVTFTEPPPSATQSLFTLDSAAVTVGTNVSIDITLKRSDDSDYGQSGGVLTLSSTPSGATFDSVTDNGDGTYSAIVSSAVADNYTLSAEIGDVTLTTTPAVSFTLVDVTNTTVSPTSLVVSVAGGSQIVTLTLQQGNGSLVGHGGHSVTVASTFIDVLKIIPMPVITDNSDGTYTITVTCSTAIGAADTVSVSVDSVLVATFSLDCDP